MKTGLCFDGRRHPLRRRHRRFRRGGLRLQRQEPPDRAALVLRPKEALPVSRTGHDPEKLRLAYRMGQECARENLDRIQAFPAAVE